MRYLSWRLCPLGISPSPSNALLGTFETSAYGCETYSNSASGESVLPSGGITGTSSSSSGSRQVGATSAWAPFRLASHRISRNGGSFLPWETEIFPSSCSWAMLIHTCLLSGWGPGPASGTLTFCGSESFVQAPTGSLRSRLLGGSLSSSSAWREVAEYSRVNSVFSP